MPRPRINPDKHRKAIALTLPPDLIGRAKAYAEFGGTTVSAWVEHLLTASIATLEQRIMERNETGFRTCECGRRCGSKNSWIAHRAVCKLGKNKP